MAIKEATNPALGFFDGMRGILAMLVVLVHAALLSHVATPGLMLTALPLLDVFMFMSGFFMAYHYRARETSEPWSSSSTWWRFYLRRFFRIAPLYYVLLTYAFVFQGQYFTWAYEFMATFHVPWDFKADPSVRDHSPLNILSHYTFLFGLVPRYAANTALPDWTVTLEVQFYLAFPFLMLLYVRLGYVWASLLLMLGWLVTHALFGIGPRPVGPLGNYPQATLLFFKIDCFVIGILLAEAYFLKQTARNASMFAGLIALMLSIWVHPDLFFFCFGLCLLFLFYDRNADVCRIAGSLNLLERGLSSRFCKYLGDSSYSVYLLHLLILIPLTAFLDKNNTYLQLSPVYRLLVLAGLSIPVVYALSHLTFNAIEKPGVKLGKKVLSRISGYPRNNKLVTAS